MRSKSEYENLYQAAINDQRLRCDPLACLEDLQRAQEMVLGGYVIERVSPKGQLIEVIEKHPEVVPKIVKAKLEVLKLLKEEVGESVECKLIVTGLDLTPPTPLQSYPQAP